MRVVRRKVEVEQINKTNRKKTNRAIPTLRLGRPFCYKIMEEQKAKTKHLETKYSIARYALIKECDGDELRFYLYVKLYAINKHSAFPSFRSFKKDLEWSKYQVNRIIKMMENKKRLKVERKTGKNNVYDITWYDNINIKGSSQETLTTTGRETLTTSRRETLTQTNNNITNRNITKDCEAVASPSLTFSYKEKLQSMQANKQRHIQVIALYWKYKGIEPENKEQYQALLKRELRMARNLVGFSDERIIEVMNWLEKEETFKWGMETIFKYITENLKRIKAIK